MEADQLSHFRWLVGTRQHRRVTEAADDDIADSRQVVGTHVSEKSGRDGVVAAAHLGPPIQQLAQAAITSEAAPGSVCR